MFFFPIPTGNQTVDEKIISNDTQYKYTRRGLGPTNGFSALIKCVTLGKSILSVSI